MFIRPSDKNCAARIKGKTNDLILWKSKMFASQ